MSEYEAEEILIGNEVSIRDEQEERYSSHGEQDHKYVQLESVSVETQVAAIRDKGKPDRHYSEIWTQFTIVSKKYNIATCNICGAKLSYRTTISNLKKHIKRKHSGNERSCFTPYKPKRKLTPARRPKLSELGGLDSIILNVVADEGQDPSLEIVGEEVEQSDVQADEVHDYCLVGEDGQVEHSEEFSPKITSLSGARGTKAGFQTKYTTSTPKTNGRNENMKRNRIMDLQMECLELKKYYMQMETLLLEQQLNLPRSLYTENLRGCENVTRSTQTDVGGSNTKVFYVTDNQGPNREGAHHLFTFEANVQE